MIEFNSDAAGNVIKRIRKEKGQSQEVCSGLAGIARSHLAMIESHAKSPNFETIWKISCAFGMRPNELVCEIEKESEKLKKSNN